MFEFEPDEAKWYDMGLSIDPGPYHKIVQCPTCNKDIVVEQSESRPKTNTTNKKTFAELVDKEIRFKALSVEDDLVIYVHHPKVHNMQVALEHLVEVSKSNQSLLFSLVNFVEVTTPNGTLQTCVIRVSLK